MILKGKDQYGATTIGVETKFFLKVSNATLHYLSKVKGLSFTSKLVNGLAIFEKSLIKLR